MVLLSSRSEVMPAAAQVAGADWLARLGAHAHRHDVVVQGRRVVWRSMGSGRPLVLLHGGHGSWLHWARNVEALAAQFEVWVPDMPGYGDSDLPWGPTLQDLVDLLRQSLERLIDPASSIRLVGFSFGGLVAASLASQWERVAALVLLGPVGHGGRRRPRGELQAWRHLAPWSPQWCAVMRHNLQMHMLYPAHGSDEWALWIHAHSCLQSRFHSKHISRAGGLHPWLQKFAGPALLVWGTHDVTADPPALIQGLVSTGSERAVSLLPACGHWVQYECADRVNALISRWMRGR